MLGLLSGGKVAEASIAPILFKRLTIRGTTLRSRTVEYQADLLKRFSKEALGLVIDGVKSKGAGHTLQIHKVRFSRPCARLRLAGLPGQPDRRGHAGDGAGAVLARDVSTLRFPASARDALHAVHTG